MILTKRLDPAWVLVPLVMLVGLGVVGLGVYRWLEGGRGKQCYVVSCFLPHRFSFERARHDLLVKIERRYSTWLEEEYGIEAGGNIQRFDASSEGPREKPNPYSSEKIRAEGWIMALAAQAMRLDALLWEERMRELGGERGAEGTRGGTEARRAGEPGEGAEGGGEAREAGAEPEEGAEEEEGESPLGRLTYEPAEQYGGVKLSNTRHSHIILQFHRKQFAYMAETVRINNLLLGSPYPSPFLHEARAHQQEAELRINMDEPERAIDHYLEAQFLLLFLIDEQQIALRPLLNP
jgi:hypothetical protein